MARTKPTCGFTGSHICTGPNSLTGGICVVARNMNAARPMKQIDSFNAKALSALKSKHSDFNIRRGGTINWKPAYEWIVSRGYLKIGLKPKSAVCEYLGIGGPKVIDVIDDDTPIRTREYWRQQNPAYEKYIRDARYQTEKKKEDNDPANILQGKNPKWKEKLNALDPWNPNAPIPGWVRFGKRDTQGFNCFVTDWNEGQWVVNKNSGYSEKIGRLTVDHTVARANLGLTTDANTKMVWGKANNKKGMKFVTYEELRNHLHSIYEPITLAPEVLDALNLLRERKVKVKL